MSATIVVGVDGSEGAVRALEFALKEAQARHADVKAVAAWQEAAAATSGVSVTPILRKGQAAEVLVAEARGAEVLVVGSRGLGGFKGLLLGSVGQQCAHHATCPVVIVPNGGRQG